MKKTISIMLAAVILSLSFLCVGASDEEITKTEKLLNDIATTKSIKIDFEDDAFENDIINIKNVEVSAKITETDGVEDVKIAASAKVLFFKVKLLITEGKVYAYIPLIRCKIDVTEILGEDVELLEPAKELMSFLESDFIEYLVLTKSGEKETEGYGKVYTEEFKVDIEGVIKGLVEDGTLEVPEDMDISNMTLDEILALMDDAEEVIKVIKAAESFRAVFVYKDDALVNAVINTVDEDGDDVETDIAEVFPFAIESITSDVDESVFKEPVLYFNFTSLFSGIVGKLAGSF
ncbi:MAG: hypothetical protein J6J45_08980 [Clostridia bacterium]|nr:hypothetical protein [Clostridia bacterium]